MSRTGLLGTYSGDGRIKRSRTLTNVIAMGEAESPIEATMLEALERIPWPKGVEIKQQITIGRYRVDFLMGRRLEDGRSDCLAVVECDGAAYHEPEEDKRRDRFMQIHGAAVLRFTGSEIERDAAKCAGEVLGWMDAAIRRSR